MSRIIRVIFQNSLHQNKNREEVNNREIRYLPDLSIFNLRSVFVLVQRILNYYPNHPTHSLYFEKVKTPYSVQFGNKQKKSVYGNKEDISRNSPGNPAAKCKYLLSTAGTKFVSVQIFILSPPS